VTAVCLALPAAVTTPALAAAGTAPTPSYAPGEVLVRFAPGVAPDERHRARSAARAERVHALALPRAQRLELRPGTPVEDAVRRLRAQPAVAWASPNWRAELTRVPDDPRFDEQWSPLRVGAPEAWDTTTGSAATLVAVIDGGIELAHPDLAAAIWQNPGETGGGKESNHVDDDGNGYADDSHGWDWADDDADPDDEDGHGTHVAGIIGARGDNGEGIAGMDWHTRLLPLRACQDHGCWSSDVMDAMAYAGRAGADVANLSLGGFGDFSGYGAVAAAWPGTLFVAGAGNNGVDLDSKRSSFRPCEDAGERPNVICVAATGKSFEPDVLADFSNYGSVVDVAAPGYLILSTVSPEWPFPYEVMSGTSMASPAVAGAAALLHAVSPGATPTQLRAALRHGQPRDLLVGIHDPAARAQTSVGSGTELHLPSSLAAIAAMSAPPTMTSAPRVTGEPRVGHELRAWRGRWKGNATTFSFRWQRAGTGGYEDVPGATRQTYTVQPADLGRRLRVLVTASPNPGAFSSSPTESVGPASEHERAVLGSAFAAVDGAGARDGGDAIRVVGDFDGDGHDDVAVTRCGLAGAGQCTKPQVRVLLGPLGAGAVDLLTPPARSFEIQVPRRSTAQVGVRIDGAGDFDGDGYDDLLVSDAYSHLVWVVFGSNAPTDLSLETPGARALEVRSSPWVGVGGEAAGVGDFDGDGKDDVGLLGTPIQAYSGSGFTDWSGGAFILYGRVDRGPVELTGDLSPSVAARVDGGHVDRPLYGARMAGVGDMDGDGFSELALSAGEQLEEPPTVHVIRGSGTRENMALSSPPPGRRFAVRWTSGSLSAPTVGGGDVDGDGLSDLVVGMRPESVWLGWIEGRGHVVYGSPAPHDIDLYVHSGPLPEEGHSIVGVQGQSFDAIDVADLDGDAAGEVVLGIPTGGGLSRAGSGNVTILRGGRRDDVTLVTLSSEDGLRLVGDRSGDAVGTAVSTGDVTGDGRAELLTIAPYVSARDRKESGRAYAIRFAPGSLSPVPAPLSFDEPAPAPPGEEPADDPPAPPPGADGPPPAFLPPVPPPGTTDAERRARMLALAARILRREPAPQPLVALGDARVYAPLLARTRRLRLRRGLNTVLAVGCESECGVRVDVSLSLRRGSPRRLERWARRLAPNRVAGVRVRLSRTLVRRIRRAKRARLTVVLRVDGRSAKATLPVAA
jgi:subtilisin family serine protease